jgi:hypothetical protein
VTSPDEHRRLLRLMVLRCGEKITRTLGERHRDDSLEGECAAYRAALGIAAEQDVRAHRDVDQLVVLTGRGRAAKLITLSGVSSYGAGRYFGVTTVDVAGIADTAAWLDVLATRPYSFLIRARLIAGHDPSRVRRLLHPDPKTGDPAFFEPCPRFWAGLDFDDIDLPEGFSPVDLDAVAAVAIAKLPDAFQRATCWGRPPPASNPAAGSGCFIGSTARPAALG